MTDSLGEAVTELVNPIDTLPKRSNIQAIMVRVNESDIHQRRTTGRAVNFFYILKE